MRMWLTCKQPKSIYIPVPLRCSYVSFLLPGCAATGPHWLIFKATCGWLGNRGIRHVEYDSLAVYINLATNLHARVQAHDMCHSSGAANTNGCTLNNQSMSNK